MTMVDRDAIARDWEERGFSCGLWVDAPGARWEDFVHDGDEIVIVLEGDVELEIEGIVQRPGPGREIFIPAGANHCVRNVGETTSRWLYGYRRRR